MLLLRAENMALRHEMIVLGRKTRRVFELVGQIQHGPQNCEKVSTTFCTLRLMLTHFSADATLCIPRG
jgi:hypothetical protein